MEPDSKNPAVSQKVLWAGRVISALPVLLLLGTGLFGLCRPALAAQGLVRYGYLESALLPVSIAEITCTLIYAIPKTSVLGAVLLTAYLGGAVATHVRAGEAFYLPVITGILVWVGLFLRERRLRELFPLRT
jgi:hypothetical protein